MKIEKAATTPQAIALDNGLVAHPAGALLLEEGLEGAPFQ